MERILKNVKPYPVYAQGLFCVGHAMNILASYDPMFGDRAAFELLRMEWSCWYNVRRKEIRHAYSKATFFSNAKSLFDIRVENIRCRNAAQFEDTVFKKIARGRPLLLWLESRQEDREKLNIDTRHITFVCCGMDEDRGLGLLLNNRLGFGWSSIEDVGAGLTEDRVQDFHVSKHVKMPSREKIKQRMLGKIQHNRGGVLGSIGKIIKEPFGIFGLKKKYNSEPPVTAICGVQGIKRFSEDVSVWKSLDREDVRIQAQNVCTKLMIMRRERLVFCNLLMHHVVAKNDDMTQRDVQSKQAKIKHTWARAAKCFANVYMGNGDWSLAETQDCLGRLFETEKESLDFCQELLGG